MRLKRYKDISIQMEFIGEMVPRHDRAKSEEPFPGL